MNDDDWSKERYEQYIASYSGREEWWIAPAMPDQTGSREWRRDEKTAIADAKKFANKHDCMYEVYKRVCIISKDN